MEKPKYFAVESIRGIACFMVVLSHLSLMFFPYLHSFDSFEIPSKHVIQSFLYESPFGFFYSGTSGVFIFFVLSGYILTKVIINDESLEKIISMTVKRYPRLMIPSLASCVLAFILFQSFEFSNLQLPDWINNYGDFSSSFLGAIYNGMIEVFLFDEKSQYNSVLWTMKIELIGSFIIFILCLNRIKVKLPFLSVTILFGTILLLLSKNIGVILGTGIVSFVVGHIFCIYGKMINIKLSLILLFIGLYLAGAHNGSVSYLPIYSILGEWTYTLCNFASGFFIVYVAIFNKEFNMLLNGRLGVFMGKVSFSVYLIHVPILSTFGIFIFNLLADYFHDYVKAAILSSIFIIILIYISSVVFYKFIDLKGIKISNYLGNFIISRYSKLSKIDLTDSKK